MATSRFRSLWISDIHLGFKECKAEFLLEFLQQSECEQLYLVGDLIDFWSLRKGGRWPSVHSEVLKAIVAKARAGRQAKTADQPRAQIRDDVAVLIRHQQNIPAFRV